MNDASFTSVEQVASSQPLEPVVHLPRAHVEGPCELRLRPRGVALRDQLQREHDILGLQTHIHDYHTIAHDLRIANMTL